MQTEMVPVNIGSQKYTTVLKEVHNWDLKTTPGSRYSVCPESDSTDSFAIMRFQDGPVKENGVNGCHNEDLLVIVLDRLRTFQLGRHPCRQNALAIQKIEEALFWLRDRTEDRERRGVEGTNNA
jgi:hypothetical protein